MAEAKNKKEKLVEMFHKHGRGHKIQVKESLVDAHLKCGWTLKK